MYLVFTTIQNWSKLSLKTAKHPSLSRNNATKTDFLAICRGIRIKFLLDFLVIYKTLEGIQMLFLTVLKTPPYSFITLTLLTETLFEFFHFFKATFAPTSFVGSSSTFKRAHWPHDVEKFSFLIKIVYTKKCSFHVYLHFPLENTQIFHKRICFPPTLTFRWEHSFQLKGN